MGYPALDTTRANSKELASISALSARVDLIREGADTPEKHGAKGDGNDDGDALIAWAASPNPLKVFTGDYHTLAGEIDFRDGSTVFGSGRIWSNQTGGALVKAKGTLTAFGSVSISEGEVIATCDTTVGMSIGDIYSIHDPDDYSFSHWRSYYKKGEFVQVLKIISPTSFQIIHPVNQTYVSKDLYTLNSKSIDINGGRFEGGDNNNFDYIGDFFGLKNSNINAEFIGGKNAALRLRHCISVGIKSRCINESPSVGLNYGLLLGGVQYINCYDSVIHGPRHGTTAGGNDDAGSVVNRYITYTNCDISNDETFSNERSADTHGNTSDVTYINCRVHNGMSIGGRNIKMLGGKITSQNTSAIAISEIGASNYEFSNVEVVIHSDADNNLLYLKNARMAPEITGTVTIIFRDMGKITFTVPQTNTGTAIRLDNEGSTHNLNFLWTGHTPIHDDARANFIKASSLSGASTSDFMHAQIIPVNCGYTQTILGVNGYAEVALP